MPPLWPNLNYKRTNISAALYPFDIWLNQRLPNLRRCIHTGGENWSPGNRNSLCSSTSSRAGRAGMTKRNAAQFFFTNQLCLVPSLWFCTYHQKAKQIVVCQVKLVGHYLVTRLSQKVNRVRLFSCFYHHLKTRLENLPKLCSEDFYKYLWQLMQYWSGIASRNSLLN